MKRRRFISAIAAAPAVTSLVAQQPAAPAAPPPAGGGGGQGFGGGRGAGGRGAAASVPRIPVIGADEAAVTTARYFSAPQFAALRKLAGVLVPPIKGNIGALDCDAVEFLDFLISCSPAARQQLYKGGLDALNAAARKQFGKPFGDLENAQAHTILKPLVVPVAWAYDPPKDPLRHFIFQAHEDIRTATRNSLEASKALANSGRRGFGGAGLYWNPIDPV
ncbi:MAG: gluconate 2-dehydrogenase subunit 3 family protein [Acidobacteriota bacterium]